MFAVIQQIGISNRSYENQCICMTFQKHIIQERSGFPNCDADSEML